MSQWLIARSVERILFEDSSIQNEKRVVLFPSDLWQGAKAERNLGCKPGVETSQNFYRKQLASVNANGKLSSVEVISPPEYEMSQRSKVCGVDVHKQFFVAALLSQTGESTIKRFQSDKSGLLEFKEWVLNEGCEQVALESTGVYSHTLDNPKVFGSVPEFLFMIWQTSAGMIVYYIDWLKHYTRRYFFQ
ncbi:MAG TPA: transposase [Methanoregulaceae archaeon]|nr:transposase [Methanoregulaceae archaeon]